MGGGKLFQIQRVLDFRDIEEREMEITAYFKSVIDQDRAAVVICNLQHTIIYMNDSAKERYKKYGDIVGKSLLACHNPKSCEMIRRVVEWFGANKSHNIMFTTHNERENKDVYMVALRDENGDLIGYYEKHEYRNPERIEPYNFS